jgi:hypothetical protein
MFLVDPYGEVAEICFEIGVRFCVYRRIKNPPAGRLLGGGSLAYSASL